MADDPKRVYWDSCVFLSYINGMEDRLTNIAAVFEEARVGKYEITTSVLSMTEVAFGSKEQEAKALDPEIERKINGLWQPPVKLVEYHALIAADSVRLMRSGIAVGHSLKGPDAIHLASAVRVGAAVFHTYDEGFNKWAEVIGIPVGEPEPEELQLLA